MAKYTELLAEYLDRGGQLPASFSLILGFTDLFKKHYCDKEIGYETELLFALKIEEKADIFMQAYADKIQRLATAWGIYDCPAKIHYTEEYKTFNAGAQHVATTELPFNSTTAEPNLMTDSDAFENSDTRASTLTESGQTIDEARASIEFLNTRIHLLIEDLLDVFKPCFMAVY